MENQILSEKKNNTLLMLFLIFAIAMVALKAIIGTYDNDLWWLLATGREILNNGFPHINPWVIHDDLNIVIQQWIPSVILYFIYSKGGMILLKAMLAFQIAILAFCLYRLCRTCSVKGKSGEIFCILIVICFLSLTTYFSSRPQIYSMIFYVLILLILEKYRRHNNRKILLFLPVITLAHVNCHSSMALFDLFIIFLYLIPDLPSFLKRKGKNCPVSLSHSDYPRIPLLIALGVSALIMLVNPYGLNGALYLLKSYGSAGYGNYIQEMGRTVMWSTYGIPCMILIILGCITIGKNGLDHLDLPLSVLFLFSIFLSIMHIRNEWLAALFAVPLIASSFHELSLYTDKIRFLRKPIINIPIGVTLAIFFGIYVYQNVWVTGIEGSDIDFPDFPTAAINYLNEYCEENDVDQSEISLLNSFNNGGFCEYYGYKVFMDPRPELWEPMITGQEKHYYKEYVDYCTGAVVPAEIVEQYDFDFYLAPQNSALEKYLSSSAERFKIAAECNGYNLWTNVT